MTEYQYCTYGELGEAFFRAAVTPERILGAVEALAGRPIEFGPMGVGPGRIVQVTAHGQIATPTVVEAPGDEISFELTVPVALDFTVDLQVEKNRFHADVEVPLRVTAHCTRDLVIVIDVEPPQAGDVRLTLEAESLRASLLKRVAGIEGELRRFIAKYVAREVEKPNIASTRVIDVGAAIDASWTGMRPTRDDRDVVDAR